MAIDAMLALDSRFRKWSSMRRTGDLQAALARGDAEAVKTAARLVSGQLGPEGLRGVSQFAMRELVTWVAPAYAELKATIEQINGTLAPAAVSDAASRLSLFECSVGQVQIWVKRPKLASLEALVRAAQKGEQDFSDYLAELRSSALGLAGGELDPYLAMVVLGMRIENGEVVLPGDMVVKHRRKVIKLNEVPEHELMQELHTWARRRMQSYGRDDGSEPHRHQLSEIDEAPIAADDADDWGKFRWNARVRVDWEAIANRLDPRTAGELRMKLDGFSVDEMGKGNYEHLRTKLPAIRKLVIDDSLHK